MEMLQEIVGSFHLERASRITAKALDEDSLPAGLQQALTDYRAEHPRRTLKPLTLRTVVDGEPTVERGAEKLPRDEGLVTFSVTTSVFSSVETQVVGHVLFCQRS
ncbi:hypothetical protein [Nakamurella lactea]|uniref:hypothetical protein n=1 Tax=Nakamurella lactea TaxID=459515 RepID=UPI0012B666E5|nr:hypothetical protein [Nakamurella lactea]